jgi:hypothetical protein
MQDGQIVKGKLKIVNIFRHPDILKK